MSTLARFFWGAGLVLTSVYCLLAFLPYTYFELIKSPAYAWMPWFATHQGVIYLLALAALFVAEWPEKRNWADFAVRIVLVACGLGFAAHPFLTSIADNWMAYSWSLIAPGLLIVSGAWGVIRHWPRESTEASEARLLPYSSAVWIGGIAALSYIVAAVLHSSRDGRSPRFGLSGLELAAWSVISHLLLAIAIFSVLNVIFLASRLTRRPASATVALAGVTGFGLLWAILLRFLNNAFSFVGLPAQIYAAALALAVTLWLGFLALPFYSGKQLTLSKPRRFVVAGLLMGASVFATVLPTLIGGSDWNGVLQGTFTLAFWVILGWGICALRPARANYSALGICAVVLLSGFAYKSLQATEIFWARQLGSTDDEVSRAMEDYGSENVSFQLAHHILGNGRGEPCDDFCRILNEYTNIRGAEAKSDLRLVEDLKPANSDRPNIFIFVIDSMRPDYVGAYNPQVDFTPNMVLFAQDSIVVHNAYTQYAGTSLSEPTIWAGAMLPHAHYIEPFYKVNSLEKLARTDNYQMMVSYDEVLSQLLSPSDDIVRLDNGGKLWNQLEVCSTIKQAEAALDRGVGKTRPVLFYTQPKNVHQFARNDMPPRNDQNWRNRSGFNNRVAYEVHQVDGCLGDFFGYLKAHGMYDNSIIIVTSDHGDALGDFGRQSHSLIIYPEVMRVPLIVHLPRKMREKSFYDDSHLSALTDIAPSLYYLLGHRPILQSPMVGHPLFVESQEELALYRRDELFMASDERAVYGLLTENGRYLYATYASPAQSFLFDLAADPNAQHSILTDSAKRQYDEAIIDHLHGLSDFWGYRPGIGSLVAKR